MSPSKAPQAPQTLQAPQESQELKWPVEAVDAKSGKVTLRGPERTLTLKVKDPAILKNVKVGDMVEAEFIEALAIKVEKAPAAK